ncbi:hypothetical protein E2562_011190 [Oryza meyeriana var. granulata]|uniref:Uncharacterized protein n=1 Tax=Oryza meyeriana var. granulata TaxID=110450 RepID=A0A6G1DH88_9ORYZ|nr:hypothetical protein E2562_011190 [Oryza meyeriana var. granulata]
MSSVSSKRCLLEMKNCAKTISTKIAIMPSCQRSPSRHPMEIIGAAADAFKSSGESTNNALMLVITSSPRRRSYLATLLATPSRLLSSPHHPIGGRQLVTSPEITIKLSRGDHWSCCGREWCPRRSRQSHRRPQACYFHRRYLFYSHLCQLSRGIIAIAKPIPELAALRTCRIVASQRPHATAYTNLYFNSLSYNVDTTTMKRGVKPCSIRLSIAPTIFNDFFITLI